MNNIYVSTVCLQNTVAVEHRIQKYIDNGITAIELGGRVKTTPQTIALLEHFPVQLLLHNYFPPVENPFYINLASPDPTIQSRSIDYIKRNIERSATFGADLYTFHAGFITDPSGTNEHGLLFASPPADEETTEKAIERFVEGLSQIIPHAESYNVHLAIENNICRREHIGQLILQTKDEFIDLFQRISSPYLGILVDIGHLQVTANTLGDDSQQFLQSLRPYIRAFHLNQNNGIIDSAEPIQMDNPLFNTIRSFSQSKMIVEANFETVESLSTYVQMLKSAPGS